MALTMRKIWTSSTSDRKERALNVRVVKMKYGMHKVKKVPMAAAETYSLEKVDGHPKWLKYVTTIEFLPKKAVKLSCSCADFMYRWETVLHSHGAADLQYSNGKAPDVRNPEQKIGTCKHSLALYSKLAEKGLV